ncbi:MAG TPA: hypothetical protein VGI12_02810 [Vicinamibacterales bacterium]|jgi:hypothetical protein
MPQISHEYVRLVLALGRHDDDYVDAYYGPLDIKAEVEAAALTLDEIGDAAAAVAASLGETTGAASDELSRLRHQYLQKQLSSMQARVRILKGEHLSFDAESAALYDAVAPIYPESHFQEVLDRLETRFPGKGLLADRYDAWRRAFVIPHDRVDRVFRAAIAACRQRTIEHVGLPAHESFTVEYVTGKAWSGYNWYQGGFRSVIQLNIDLPIYIDRAVDLAGHEGYPGHHLYNALLEQRLVIERGWIEFTVYPLFSPQSLVAEGTANFGIEVAFPGGGRVDFEESTLFPLAGLDPARAAEYYEVQALVDDLSYAGNEAARRYHDGAVDRDGAAAWLERYALMPHERALQRVRFFDQYRSYVINYNYGKDLVRRFIESRGGTADRPDERWRQFELLLSSPRLPSGLR